MAAHFIRSAIYMNAKLIRNAIVSIAFVLVIAVAVSCGEREEGDDDDGRGGNVNPGPISTVVCAANCSAAAACTGHGGVNCPVGPDVDGSVICADGYRDSSIKYQCQ